MTHTRTGTPTASSPFLVERTDIGLRIPVLQQERPTIALDGVTGHVPAQVFDFEAIADATFLGSFAADARRPNLLLHCGAADMPRLVPRLMRLCAGPVRSCMVGGLLALPAEPTATLILHDASRLSVMQQIEVVDWLSGRGGRTQVVSISGIPLRPLVEAGLFLEGLFHRLAVVQAAISRRQLTANPAESDRRHAG